MAGNSWGQIFRVTSFGESHGPMIGAVIDGCPAGLELDLELIQAQLDKRKPGQSKITTQRKESDQFEIVSGLYQKLTTGTPLAALIHNEDARSKDYSEISDKFRPSHADYTYEMKYGHRDPRGGGRSSARETAARVFAGAVAQQLIAKKGIQVFAYVSQVGNIICPVDYSKLDLTKTYDNIVRCPHQATSEKMIELIESIRKQGDTIGGVITGVIKSCPVGLGEPVFDKLHAELGKAMLSINAVKAFEIGSGFQSVGMKGSEYNDSFVKNGDKVTTTTNHSGGIQGGISNGMDIYFRVAFKPVATLMQVQDSINKKGEKVEIEGKGRHDPCVLPRATAIVEAMSAIVIADHWLRHLGAKI
jgi:chorismate synthase